MTRKKKVIFAIVAVLFLFALTEILLRIFAGFIGFGENAQKNLEPYQGKSWTEQYFKDGADCREQTLKKGRRDYERFILYDTGLNCTTPTQNYSTANGRTRKTWNPSINSSTLDSHIKNIAMFGGSTTEGVGAIDDETIPSWLSRELNGTSTTKNVKYIMTNYGTSGYTYTQSVMKLILKLREGKRFDYVIFYNGVNDIDNAYDNGAPGALFQENWTIAQLEGSGWQKVKYWMTSQVQACQTCKAVAVIGRNAPFLKKYFVPILAEVRSFLLQKQGDKQGDDKLPEFAQGIADYYSKSHNLLGILSKAYGFKYFEFWQPTLVNDSPTPGEKVILGMDHHFSDPKLQRLYALTHDSVLNLHLNNFYDLSDVLRNRKIAYYLDSAHLSGDANKIIADNILSRIRGNMK